MPKLYIDGQITTLEVDEDGDLMMTTSDADLQPVYVGGKATNLKQSPDGKLFIQSV